MTDHFAVLAQPRRPWLDPEALRESFQRAAAGQHPDAPGGEDARFAALNAAHNILRDPGTRLRHLLELIAPDRPPSPAPIPPDLADLFMHIASLRRAVEDYRRKLSAATSPLSRALLAGETARLRGQLETGLARLNALHDSATATLHELDTAWHPTSAPAIDELAQLQARFAFLGKWASQVREDLFQLSA
jgi:curved DNA-binding protein CbpA